jgi:integrase
MASIRKVGKKYRVELYRNGQRESSMFHTKAEASAWALQREAELDGRALPFRKLSEAFVRYAAEVSPTHRGERWEVLRLKAFGTHKIANKPIAKLSTEDLIDWRDNRLKQVSKGTVLREMNLIGSVLEHARKEWRWIRDNPIKDVTKPRQPKGRKRRVSQGEIDRLITASGYAGAHDSMLHITVAAFLFAIETGMRSGEILGLEWADVDERKVTLRQTKNGDSREVPLSPKARLLLAALRCFEKPFDIANGTRDALFRKLVKQSGIENLHFHDARAEAIYRLSKELDVMTLARAVGHRDLKSLMLYYNESGDEMGARLG